MRSPLQLLNRVPRGARLLVALLLSAALYAGLSARHTGPVMAFLLAWILFSGVILLFSWNTILLSNPHDTALAAGTQDESRLLTFLFIVSAAFISLFAIIALLQGLPRYTRAGLSGHIALSVVAVTCSWFLIHTLFTLRYAHLYYRDPGEDSAGKGLRFPANAAPDMLDFAYFSFVLGMTFQVSDVSITDRRIRRLVLLHSLLAFIYNTVIVAFTINILSGIIGR